MLTLLAPSPSPGALALLRGATREAHEALHVHPLLIALSNGSVTRPVLKRALVSFYGFHAACEAALKRSPAPAEGFAASPQRDWIEADLKALGMTAEALAALPGCPGIAAPRDPGERMGLLYVTEGSTLGGQMIAKALHHALGIEADGGYRFFAGHGPKETGRRWKELCIMMEHLGEAEADAAAHYATSIFTALKGWLDRPEAHRFQ